MPKDTREVHRGVRLPTVRNKEGKITERARTVTDVDEVQKLDSATRSRLAERGAVTGFGVTAYGMRGTEEDAASATTTTADADKANAKGSAQKGK